MNTNDVASIAMGFKTPKSIPEGYGVKDSFANVGELGLFCATGDMCGPEATQKSLADGVIMYYTANRDSGIGTIKDPEVHFGEYKKNSDYPDRITITQIAGHTAMLWDSGIEKNIYVQENGEIFAEEDSPYPAQITIVDKENEELYMVRGYVSLDTLEQMIECHSIESSLTPFFVMERSLLKKLALSVSITVAILAIAIYLLNESQALSESDMEYFPIADPCDLNCKKILEEQRHTCIELETNSYACRTEILPRPEGSIYSYVTPPELGEYFLFPPSSDQQLGSITKISLLPNHSIQIAFDEKYGTDSIVIETGQKFTSYCFEQKNVHVWTFTGMVEVSGKQYIEIHKRLAKIPDGFDCSNPVRILRK